MSEIEKDLENLEQEAAAETAEDEPELSEEEREKLLRDDAEKSPARNEIFTIPNVLTFLRIILIPVFMYFFLNERIEGHMWYALGVLVLSGISDVLDGIIARKFNMVSDLGIALDPIADKLTQFGVMLCLVFRFPGILIPLLLIVIKEVVTGIFALMTIRKTGLVKGAKWYGKLTTVLLYIMMGLHLLWPLLHQIWPGTFIHEELPSTVSVTSIVVCCVMMLISFVLYVRRFILIMKVSEKEKEENQDGK